MGKLGVINWVIKRTGGRLPEMRIFGEDRRECGGGGGGGGGGGISGGGGKRYLMEKLM